MLVFQEKTPLQEHLKNKRTAGQTIGYVATMGALHGGHETLLKLAREQNDLVVASIYVNPTQFNSPADLENYPRDLDQDREVLESAGCDVLFMPDNSLMYPTPPAVRIELGSLQQLMEGQFRPGHFNGVSIVVMKLFNLIRPERAYFGQKDLQQYIIIRNLVDEFFLDIEVVCVPTAREPNGLAMSSRNKLLNDSQRNLASNLHKALQLASRELSQGKSPGQVERKLADFFQGIDGVELEYFNIVDSETLEPVLEVKQHEQVALCIAGYVNRIRLIDNIFVSS